MTSSPSAKTIVGVLVIVAVAIVFWMIAISPKRQQSSDLGVEVEQQQSALAASESKVNEATAAKKEFPSDYSQLVILGKAVPAGEETPSLLVQLNRIADKTEVQFDSLQLSDAGSEEVPAGALAPEASATSSVPTSATVPPTEAEAALLPLGSTIGSAGLGVMPYNLSFSGSFFQIADFINGVDALVETENSTVGVDGRLITLDGFALIENSKSNSGELDASFAVTTYVVPPNQGVTAGATPTSPATEAEPASRLKPLPAPRPPSRRPQPDEAHQQRPGDQDAEAEGAALPSRHLPRPRRPPPAAAGRASADRDRCGPVPDRWLRRQRLLERRSGSDSDSECGGRWRERHAGGGQGRPVAARLSSSAQVPDPEDPFAKRSQDAETEEPAPEAAEFESTPPAESVPTTPSEIESSGGGETPPLTETGTTKTKITYFTYAIDVRVTPVSKNQEKAKSAKTEATVRRELPPLTMLPSRETPAFTYIGPSRDASKALMLVSSEVTSMFGDSHCVSGADSCQLLALEPDLPQTIIVGPNERTYRIELLKVQRVFSDHLEVAPLGDPRKNKDKGQNQAG